ncbi:MAG: hypothetical protein M1838_001972 [Thelocarpon superellum]|nr:MAG: hypothetical protein M1838_001972 [Thelocarpon superellum]
MAPRLPLVKPDVGSSLLKRACPKTVRLHSSFSPSNPSSLATSQCLITGASRGIGLAIATRVSALGASCILVGRDGSSLNKARQTVLDASSSGAQQVSVRTRVGDVGERDFWESVGRDLKDVDVLINAAGVAHYSLLMATKPELVERVVRTNLMGPVWAGQIVGRNMVRRRKGCIINISSLLGVKGGKGSVAYAASKAGLLGLTRSLAAEIGPSNVRVNAIVPGYVETQMTDARDDARNTIPLNRFGQAEEVADAAIFLASNPYANNCVLNLDGGLSAV